MGPDKKLPACEVLGLFSISLDNPFRRIKHPGKIKSPTSIHLLAIMYQTSAIALPISLHDSP